MWQAPLELIDRFRWAQKECQGVSARRGGLLLCGRRDKLQEFGDFGRACDAHYAFELS